MSPSDLIWAVLGIVLCPANLRTRIGKTYSGLRSGVINGGYGALSCLDTETYFGIMFAACDLPWEMQCRVRQVLGQ